MSEYSGKNRLKSLSGQQKIGLLLLVLGFILFFYLSIGFDFHISVSWLFGLMVGFTLQKSRICFTAALRDPVIFGMTALLRALILSLMLTTLGFAILQFSQSINGLELSGKIIPLGWNIPIGGFIFGLGAAISGGCASGTLVRMGEGFKMQWLVIIGFIGGSIHGAYDTRFWYQLFNEASISHIPSRIGWPLGIIIQLLVL